MATTHCWKDYRSYLEEIGKIYSEEWVQTYYGSNMTCMRESDHEGDHEFVNDDQIVITFKP